MALPCLMSALNSIGGSCFGWAGERIQTEANLLFSYGDNIMKLRKQVQDLSDAVKSVEDRIEDAANNRGATLVDAIVVRLLERMTSLKDEASKIITDDERSSDSTCLMGLRPNLLACYMISKSARKVIDEVAELLEKEKKLDMHVANVDYSKFLGVKPIREFEEFESRMLVSNQIMAALKDPSVNMVGIYGMGGTGKTTLAEKIGADLQLDNTFSFVILATVSEKQNQRDNNYQPDLFNIQKQIAEGFKIQVQGETLKIRAAELDKQLQRKDKVLIILDDIWSGFELKDVGIPIDNVDKRMKILMTSRSEAVLLKSMNLETNFGLDSLPYPDAFILFDRMVGGHTKYYKWRPTAEQVVNQCGGIPIILVTVAKALRNEALESWEDTLTQLKKFEGENIFEAYKMIEVSYKFLNSEEKKKLLILCAQLNHHSIPIENLLKYAIGLNLFNGCKKIKEIRNRLHRYLSDLKGCCLLQDGNEEGSIKMHDVVYKFVSFVASRDHGVLNVAYEGELEDWPSKDKLEHLSSISLPFCDLPPNQMLLAGFDNPNLESFLLLRSTIDASFRIPKNFFVGMKGLKLMDVAHVSLSSVLVSSISALVNLQTLCLDGCKLSDISMIGDLPMLQVLSLVGSSIVLVPKEIGKLGNTLKLLDLSYCNYLKKIAAGVIFKLTLLEDLRIGYCFTRWEPLEGRGMSNDIVDENKEEMASMEEFKNLHNLINVEIHILEHAKMFPKDLVFKKLETFNICFGNMVWSSSNYASTRTLKIREYSKVVDFHSEGTKSLMIRAEKIVLEGVKSCVSVSEMATRGFPELKHLTINSGDEIKYIVMKNYNNCIFPKLEILYLSYLSKLKRICDHALPVGSFENLRVIIVRGCKLLKDLFSSNLARDLLCLNEIKVSLCESMESIIVSGEGESENEEEIQIGFTHQLRILELCSLPRLISFHNFKQLEGHPSPAHLFNKRIMFSKLEELKLEQMKVEKIWDDHLAAEGTCWLQNLTRLIVYECTNLSYLFTSSMVKSLANLKLLEVNQCDSIKEIVVATREGEIEGERLLLFPKIESLYLCNLPKLNRFCHANLLECQSLQMLAIKKCPLLGAFIGGNKSSLFHEKIIFPKLEELELTMMKIEKIWDVDHFAIAVEETTCWFQNLTSLQVSDCENLSYLFTFSMVKSLAKLKQLEVSNCESIKEIVASTVGDVQLLFPKLENMKLQRLRNLKRFCQVNLLECQLLRKLHIESCLKMKTFVSANDSSSSDNSKILFTEKVAFPNIEELDINTGNLKMICGNQLHPNSFSRLKILRIAHVEDLLNVFTHSMSRRALDLEKLEIIGCESLEKVFDVQILSMNERETCINLRSMLVSDCPSLTSICSAYFVPTILQQLERFEVRNCDKIVLFCFNNPQQLNDAFAKVTSRLTYCYLESSGLKLKYEHQRFELKIDRCGFEVPPMFFALLQSVKKLEKVVVSNSSIIHLFPCETDHLAGDDIDTEAKTLARIRQLQLTKLPNMKYIWSEHPSLAPSSTTLFKNLTSLIVGYCPKLMKLLASSSTAKSLINLKRMSVRACDSFGGDCSD